MRLAFVWFNTNSPVGISHGVLILARELAQAGHAVEILHLNEELGLAEDPDTVVTRLKEIAPDLIGLSFASSHASQARILADRLSKELPEVFILCGGIHTTLVSEEVIDWPGVDAIGIGELDNGPLVEFVNLLASGGSRYRQTPGFWLKHNNEIHRNRLARLPNLDNQALPLYELIDLDRLVQAKRGFGEVLAGRGCPFRCNFCQNHALVERYRVSLGGTPAAWPYCRQRSVSNLLEEIELLRSRAPSTKAIMFGDDRMAFDKTWLADFSQQYPARIGLPFIINATADQIDEQTAALLEQAGCNMVKLGVECAPGRIRREVLNRPFGEKLIRQAFSALKRYNINTMAYLMIGIPSEKSQDVLATYRFCASLQPDAVRVSMFCPFPGTKIYTDLVDKGQLLRSVGVYGFLKDSILDWPEEMQLFLDKSLALGAWLLNGHLGGQVGEKSQEFTDTIFATDRETWKDREYQEELKQHSTKLLDDFRDKSLKYYHAPFPERPDYAFLAIQRRYPLINVDRVKDDPV
ncbi:MAG: B12-binding domain-containing radical SAM protein [Deltaproteobacteria bacterium]|nr:B12-binding domain-containing radical SAM protein [Deltaproteobacteria bacterium]